MESISIEKARRCLAGRYLVVLTGAGMSVESGVPPFRGPDGLWRRLDPDVEGHVRTLSRDPERSWRLFRELAGPIGRARPHEGHAILARQERSGRVLGLLTTNVDGLHQDAGSRRVTELHGSARELVCHECGRTPAPGYRIPESGVPRCPRCRGTVRPRVVLFGEILPEGAWEAAMQLVEEAEGLVAVGTSLEVQPAAAIPSLVRRRGLPVVEIGPQPSELARSGRSQWLEGLASTTLPALLAPPRRAWLGLFR